MGIVLQSASGIGSALATTLVALAAFAGVGWLIVRWASARGGLVVRREGARRLHVLERQPLDFKSSLYVVRAGERTLLIGCGEGAPPRLIVELELGADPTSAPAEASEVQDG